MGSAVEEDVNTLEEMGGTSELDKTDPTLLSEDAFLVWTGIVGRGGWVMDE